ncbi:DUF2637 domain-containing protein [Streptomyces sp. NBC_00457]|uniref:DUF2637 domain-containing protein n=1 Tax=Streptomyces sp. NBC_00457 TaxID=2975748 RepID=UPI002E1DBD14
MAAPVQLTRTHRVLIGVVVFGAVVIAGIGFAGSYAAVRELALQKGFGDFSYVFPIGIDAGICVLLALDLLLTWIRIPFPLLRQTAWVLTVATIAFNGAAAWPDPLGVGMHAVIPVLFVVSVEAARHAIGRIADITADKHMEGVRMTRWLLAPVPTFLLWRRMKLWELRSYDQVIKLEQERLVYQARLRSRFGRGWRRKAPVESLMPLRLAKYGVPLADTAPAGLAAAGLAPTFRPPAERAGASTPPEHASLETPAVPDQQMTKPDGARPRHVPASAPKRSPAPQESTEDAVDRFAESYQAYIAQFHVEPTAAQWALWLRDAYGISTAAGAPLSEEQTQPLLRVLPRRAVPQTEEIAVSEEPQADFVMSGKEREFTGIGSPADEAAADPGGQAADELPQEEHPEAAPAGMGAQAATERRGLQVNTPIDAPLPGHDDVATKRAALTTVDRYYLVWMECQAGQGEEPTAEQLSAALAAKGMYGRGRKPVSPANLRRYLLPFRLYNVWAQHRAHGPQPSLNAIAQECAARGITGQYNKTITTDHLTHEADDFERRWQALTHHRTSTQR